MTREPLITRAGLTSAVTAVIALLTAYGLDITDDQQAAILGIIAVAAPLIVAVTSRMLVTPIADPRDELGDRLIPEPTISDPLD
ncbi:hypothetical protein KIH74_22995 [Kineosporia sp. J2-2]|uniref:Holin n=1 Tax=Kineosporia corallincola TaxID=2835133 RepID=A0ABS5TL47_9ACTN|nr:hypothetical protein [Kineosporia corallincola]MBT0771827.1 hypothetical protein [Kineosporia corallincola]